MSTISMLRSLKCELSPNECNAVLEIIDRLCNGGNTIYGTQGYITEIEKKHDVSIEDINNKISEQCTHHKVSQKRIGKDLDLL